MLKRMISLGFGFTCLLFATSGLAQSGYVSVTQLREQTPARWTQTYDAHGRTIAVDVAIEIPAVEEAPTLNATQYTKEIPKEAVADYSKISVHKPGHFYGYVGKELEKGLKDGEKDPVMAVYQNGEFPKIGPEDNPASFEHALGLVTARLDAITGYEYGRDYFLDTTRVMGRRISRGKPTSAMGRYEIFFNQDFHGFKLSQNSRALYAFVGDFYDDENLLIVANNYYDSYAVLDADVPLLPFEAVQGILEQEIAAGRLRSIDSIALRLAPFGEIKREQGQFVLLPVWEVVGAWAKDAAYEPEEVTIDGEIETYWELSSVADLSAQDGTLYHNPYERADAPHVVTWEEVQR